MTSAVSEINFFDPQTDDCPYPAYQLLRSEAPVWKDPVTGMFFVSRYEDIRTVLLDTKRFSNAVGSGAADVGKAVTPEDPEKAKALLEAMAVEEELTQFAVPLPLYVIGKQVGMPEEAMPRIKGWTRSR